MNPVKAIRDMFRTAEPTSVLPTAALRTIAAGSAAVGSTTPTAIRSAATRAALRTAAGRAARAWLDLTTGALCVDDRRIDTVLRTTNAAFALVDAQYALSDAGYTVAGQWTALMPDGSDWTVVVVPTVNV